MWSWQEILTNIILIPLHKCKPKKSVRASEQIVWVIWLHIKHGFFNTGLTNSWLSIAPRRLFLITPLFDWMWISIGFILRRIDLSSGIMMEKEDQKIIYSPAAPNFKLSHVFESLTKRITDSVHTKWDYQNHKSCLILITLHQASHVSVSYPLYNENSVFSLHFYAVLVLLQNQNTKYTMYVTFASKCWRWPVHVQSIHNS